MIEHGRSVREVAGRLGIRIDSLYALVRERRESPQVQQTDSASLAEMRRLQTELKRATEERDILLRVP